jgi:alpha-D-ribose 1-methylphosphonate 5-triphosphate synthase subunit PhnH
MHADSHLDLADIGPGLNDAVADAQRVFRLALDAIAHPGRIVELPADVLLEHNAGLPDAATALALTLLDFETPVWLAPAFESAADYLRFHCGAPVVADPKASRFAFATPESLPALDAFDLGDIEFPDRSTTLVLAVPALEASGGLVLRGPGIEHSCALRVGGCGPELWGARAVLTPLFPLGLDVILTCGRRLAALPRTTHVEGY